MFDALSQFESNRSVADFYCPCCRLEFELKGKAGPFGKVLVNGAYSVKMDRLASDATPNLTLLSYDPDSSRVVDLTLIPARFFRPSIVERRRPLGPNARRAGWVGSNIRLDLIPNIGRIEMIRGGTVTDKTDVNRRWQRTAFVANTPPEARGWLADVMARVDRIEQKEFSLEQVYEYEEELRTLYPRNANIRPKIRQQLQVMRDNGLLEFVGRGRYRKLP